ncbi:MAG: histidine phosphatase family protein [Opitutaceae bacterium]|jgi:probable phosphoglycerate mutase
MPRQVIVVRHGETLWSLTGKHTGRTDLSLTENGKLRASRLRLLLRGINFDHVLTSPLKRARQTCDLAGLGTFAQIEPDLQEWDYGDFEGRTTPEICAQQPGWNVFQDGCPGGESVAEVSQRADRLLAAVRALSGNVALFSHGQFLRVVAMRWIGLAASEGQHLALDTASISVLGFEHHNGNIPAVCLWNSGSDTASGLLAAPRSDPGRA